MREDCSTCFLGKKYCPIKIRKGQLNLNYCPNWYPTKELIVREENAHKSNI
jgi:hypothetical protein